MCCEKDLGPNCVKHELQRKVQKEECEKVGELLPHSGIPVGILGNVGAAAGPGHGEQVWSSMGKTQRQQG